MGKRPPPERGEDVDGRMKKGEKRATEAAVCRECLSPRNEGVGAFQSEKGRMLAKAKPPPLLKQLLPEGIKERRQNKFDGRGGESQHSERGGRAFWEAFSFLKKGECSILEEKCSVSESGTWKMKAAGIRISRKGGLGGKREKKGR